MDTYELLDSGNERKLERFGDLVLDRPCAQALWKPRLSREKWSKADARFDRDPEMCWSRPGVQKRIWKAEIAGLCFQLQATDFGHVGVFPEHRKAWEWVEQFGAVSVLNLFAYSGGATLAAAKAGAEVCHLDASKGMVAWARENAALNDLDGAKIRWIIDDVHKFMQRELRRERFYDVIILDPPSFGRGSRGEVFKIERDMPDLLEMCVKLLGKKGQGLFLSCHSPGITPKVLEILLRERFRKGAVSCGEMCLEGSQDVFSVPSGSYACWRNDDF